MTPGPRPTGLEPLQPGAGDLVQDPPHRGRRRDRAEHTGLLAQHVDVTDRLASIGAGSIGLSVTRCGRSGQRSRTERARATTRTRGSRRSSVRLDHHRSGRSNDVRRSARHRIPDSVRSCRSRDAREGEHGQSRALGDIRGPAPSSPPDAAFGASRAMTPSQSPLELDDGPTQERG